MILNPNANPESKKFKEDLDKWLEPYWKTATPGLCIEVYHRGVKTLDYYGGTFYKYYDLSSLTKVLFTVPAMMLALSKGFWNIETKVSSLLLWWPHKETKIVDLLTHSSGLLWWKPFYKALEKEPELHKRWKLLQEDLMKSTIEVTPKAVYSDLGFLALSFILKEFWAPLELSQIWNLVKSEFAPGSTLHWNNVGDKKISADHQIVLSDYAPTEDCQWRNRRLVAEVHDENAWILGGLSTHAGLFGTSTDVATVFLKFRSLLFNSTHPLSSIVKLFIKRQFESERGDWALGFMMPTLGSSSSGKYFSEPSIGHLGFTGTSVWWDPEYDLVVVVLSNRVYFGREQREFAKLRPVLHDRILEYLKLINTQKESL